MDISITRRGFFKSCGVLATGAVVLGAARPARAAYQFRFTHDSNYNGNWVPWLRNVVGGATRMIQVNVIANAVRLSGKGYNLAPRVWERSNLANNPVAYWRHQARVMEWQLASLRGNNFQPRLHIRWAYEQNESWWGKADLNTAALVYTSEPTTWIWRGGSRLN